MCRAACCGHSTAPRHARARPVARYKDDDGPGGGEVAVAAIESATPAARLATPAVAATATSSAAHAAAADEQAAQRPFVWTRHWWPLMPVDYLDPGRPNPVMLMGLPLVAWRDGGGAWRVFHDACPHRLAPLSGGGRLGTSGHGTRHDDPLVAQAYSFCRPPSVPLCLPPSRHMPATAIHKPDKHVRILSTLPCRTSLACRGSRGGQRGAELRLPWLAV
jgi:hypothetical protein